MARQLKPLKVTTFRHKDRTECDIYLNRNTKEFFANVQGEHIEAATERECRRKAEAKYESLVDLPWRKIIVVETQDQYGFSCGPPSTVRLKYTVCTVATAPNGNWMEQSIRPAFHRTTEEVVCDYYHGCKKTDARRGNYVFDWSAELEASLAGIVAAIKEVRRRLDGLMGCWAMTMPWPC